MLSSYPFIFFSSFFAALIFVFFLKRMAKKYGVLVSRGMPLVGGIAIGLSLVFMAYLLIPGSFSQETKGIIAASFIMLIFGAIDDLRELSVPVKFLAQIIVTSVLILFGVKTQIVYIGSLANIVITFIWVVGISNAFNHLDVIDGLAGGSALIIGLTFFVISFLNTDIQNTILALTISGAILGFLLYNLPPAKVYLGNSGSHFLGFLFAAVALAISYAPLERKIALLSPLFILGFPIFDTGFLILVRMRQKKSILKKSDDHLALRFIKSGYSKNKSLTVMLVMNFLFCLCGVIISKASNLLGSVIVIAVSSFSLVLVYKMSKSRVRYRCLEKGYLF